MNIKKTIKSFIPDSLISNFQESQRKKNACERFKKKSPGDYYSLDAFDYYKCIFVHVPKAAGVSINKSLFGNLAGGHYSLRDYQKMYLEQTFKNYFKFTIVRNPYDRLYSAYTFLKQGGFGEIDALWTKDNLSQINSYDQFVKKWVNEENIYTKNHFTPQFEYLIDKEGEIGVDFMGRFEHLTSDFKIICDKIGIHRELKHSNKTKRKEKPVYDDEMIQIINSVYCRDFELLGYEYK